MRKILSCFLIFAFVFASCPDASVWMQKLNDEIIDAIKSDQSESSKAKIIEDVFKPYLDVEKFTKKIIGRPYWLEASDSDREQIQKYLYHVMLSDYSHAVVQTLANKPEVYRVKKNDDNNLVVTVAYFTQREKTLLANFSMSCDNDAWKIFDISVEGVSLSELQNSKYKKILNQGGVAGLNAYFRTYFKKLGE